MGRNKVKRYTVTNDLVPRLVGDSHRHETKKGIISLIYPCITSRHLYEIYCIEGNLFEDIERFDTLERAEIRIEELLI